MADTAHLNLLADSYPPHVGWLHCDHKVRTVLTLNAAFLTRDPHEYPLQARVRAYSGGALIKEYFTPHILPEDSLQVDINALLSGESLIDGYMEVAVFSHAEKGVAKSFFGEMWCSVFSEDGLIGLNYPPLNFKGVDVRMVDARCLYYPGICVERDFDAAVILINQYGFDSDAEIIIYDASGVKELRQKVELPRKSAVRVVLSDAFDDADDFFNGEPGFLLTRFPYKMNGFVQTIQRQSGAIHGMDHLGFLATHDTQGVAKITDLGAANAKRIEDPVVCFCKAASRNQILKYKEAGMNYNAIASQCEIGEICRGCETEVREILGDWTG